MTKGEVIFVVGFPKSGNTWLAKMLCQVFNAELVDDDPNQLEINARLENNPSQIKVVKSHFLPEQLLNTYKTPKYRVFYIFRDFRDVSVSAWFYFSGMKKRVLRLDEPYKDVVVNLKNPKKYRSNRVQFKNFVHGLSENGLPNLPQFSTWQNHIDIWQKWGAEPGKRLYSLTYADLRTDTHGQLSAGIEALGLEGLKINPVQLAVEKEKFKSLKRFYHEQNQQSNASFLRAGVVGDWKNYFHDGIAKGISHQVISKLIDLGFEPDDSWIADLPKEKLGPDSLAERITYLKCKIKHQLS